MFTAIKLGDSLDKQKGLRTVTVKFTDGVQEFEQDFKFDLDETVDNIKGVIKRDLDKKNVVPESIPDGEMIFPVVINEITEPTAEDLDKLAYETERERLKILKEDVSLGLASEAEYAEAVAVLAVLK